VKSQIKPELLADYFINYLYSRYRGNRHVRRIASWVGLVVLSLLRAKGVTHINRRRTRQLAFEYMNRMFKVKFNHAAGPRGGIEITEFYSGQGEPEGKTVLQIKNLLEAEDVYQSLESHLKKFISANP
jgi:hypothetical protein